jgi:hypothetical protein
MTTPKLNQVLAIEKGVKSKTHSTLTQLYHRVQKNALLAGQSRTYTPLDEDGVKLPPESQRVQVRADDVLKNVSKSLIELFNVTAQKDMANRGASADIVVDGNILLEGVPVTYLLFLEKQLTDLKTMVAKIPTLDADTSWTFDANAGVFRSEATETTKTKKVQKPIVLYPATPEHPAQTQLVTEDVVVGNWTTVRQSGALPSDRKERLGERIVKVLEAVKFARESANSAEAPRHTLGDDILGFIFG